MIIIDGMTCEVLAAVDNATLAWCDTLLKDLNTCFEKTSEWVAVPGTYLDPFNGCPTMLSCNLIVFVEHTEQFSFPVYLNNKSVAGGSELIDTFIKFLNESKNESFRVFRLI